MKVIGPAAAAEYASWFRCLGDRTRIRILNAAAGAPGPLTVGEIAASVGRSQSTVSRHLQILAAGEFVTLQPEGVRTLVRVNESCMTDLPAAAAAIMAQEP